MFLDFFVLDFLGAILDFDYVRGATFPHSIIAFNGRTPICSGYWSRTFGIYVETESSFFGKLPRILRYGDGQTTPSHAFNVNPLSHFGEGEKQLHETTKEHSPTVC